MFGLQTRRSNNTVRPCAWQAGLPSTSSRLCLSLVLLDEVVLTQLNGTPHCCCVAGIPKERVLRLQEHIGRYAALSSAQQEAWTAGLVLAQSSQQPELSGIAVKASPADTS